MSEKNEWKLVPVVPTEEMLIALGGMGWMVQQKPESYAAMLAAAPSPATVPNADRDWELTCDECNGDGFVYVERRVGPCQTDIQTFKEECECCEGRGFTIAFEDIPGIEAYVKSCRPTPASAQPESMRTGHPHEDPHFVALCREHDILGTAMQGLAAVFWREGGSPAPSAPGDAIPQQGEA